MTRNKHLLFLALTLLVFSNVKGQDRYEPKKIKAKGDYIHEATNTTFPTAIDNYIRTEVTSYDKKKTNISANYENETSGGKTKFTVYLYPVGIESEQELRYEYLNSLQSIAYAADKSLNAAQEYCSYKKDGYKIHGYSAYILADNRNQTALEIYQCGSWFLKIRVTSDVLDTAAIDILNKRVVDLFSPVNLVKTSALSLQPHFNVSKKALRDSLMLGCIMSSTFKKLEWLEANVDSTERASGFPDLYLDMYVESLKDFVKYAEEHKDWHLSNSTKEYLDQLNSLIANGFLDEFIMEQFSNVMIVPDKVDFDFKSFDHWKISHPININLNERYCVITYEPKE